MPSSGSQLAIDSVLWQRRAAELLERCDEIAQCTDRPGEVTRLFCSPAMAQAHAKLRHWMAAAGLSCRVDSAGNVIGRLPRHGTSSDSNGAAGKTPSAANAQVLLIGSHLDSVVNAGRYDGVLGVLMGLAVAELIRESLTDVPFAIDVIGFSEEEGVRFSTAYIGSLAIVEGLPASLLERRDADGVTVADALRSFGCDPANAQSAKYAQDEVVAFIEPHIEQGPVLESRNLPVGVVSGIAGQTRACVRFVGKSGHAGTVPMDNRQDALAAAAELILATERVGSEYPGLVATVGQIKVEPNVSNVIAGEVQLRLDVRHLSDEIRSPAVQKILDEAQAIASTRGLKFEVVWINHHESVQFNRDWVQLLAEAVAASGYPTVELASGAGHDAAVLAKKFNTAMLFIRCAGGVSHHPAEAVIEHDVAIALEVLYRFVMQLAANGTAQINQPAATH